MMGKQSEGKPKPFRWLVWGLIALVLIAVVLGLNWYFLHAQIAPDSLDDRGTFGDMFGLSNAIFSGIAFVGIIITIWMQKEELSLQRKELSDTREVLKHQANQLEQQSNTLIAQKEENTFFQLLKLRNDIIEGVSFAYPNPKNLKGRAAFKEIVFLMLAAIKGDPNDAKIKKFTSKYPLLYEKFSGVLGYNFRLLYQIVRFVDDMKIEEKQKHLYMGVIIAQLSQAEMELIYLNCLSDTGSESFKSLVEKYGLLKAMPFNDLASLGDEETLKSYYNATAFGEPAKE